MTSFLFKILFLNDNLGVEVFEYDVSFLYCYSIIDSGII